MADDVISLAKSEESVRGYIVLCFQKEVDSKNFYSIVISGWIGRSQLYNFDFLFAITSFASESYIGVSKIIDQGNFSSVELLNSQ